jgi:hypothetical protein
MKNLFFLALLLLTSKFALAQNIDECRKVVDLTIKSINNQSPEELNNYLADDFTIAGQKGEIAKMVLKQLFSQLGENVNSHQEIRQNRTDKELELVYNIDYKTLGMKEAVFIFTKNNLLKELTLFKMEVKTMNNETNIEKSSQDVIEIPFTMAGNLIAVKVLLNGEYRTFILDSGAPKVILNSKYISEKDTNQKTISSSKGVSGNISGMDIMKVEQLDFSGIKLNNQDVITLDLSHLEESLEIDLYGLIGYDLIKDYDLIYDYANLKLTLINPDIYESYKNENLAHNTLRSVPFDLESHIPIVKSQIGSLTLTYGIDCGAESNLISDKLFEPLKKYTKQIKTDTLIGAENQPKKVNKGKIKKTKIGTKSFKNLSTIFSDISHLNEGYKINIDGLIGYEILHKQKTLISYIRKEMIFIE